MVQREHEEKMKLNAQQYEVAKRDCSYGNPRNRFLDWRLRIVSLTFLEKKLLVTSFSNSYHLLVSYHRNDSHAGFRGLLCVPWAGPFFCHSIFGFAHCPSWICKFPSHE